MLERISMVRHALARGGVRRVCFVPIGAARTLWSWFTASQRGVRSLSNCVVGAVEVIVVVGPRPLRWSHGAVSASSGRLFSFGRLSHRVQDHHGTI